jgi:hypothetical protein
MIFKRFGANWRPVRISAPGYYRAELSWSTAKVRHSCNSAADSVAFGPLCLEREARFR